MREIDNQCPQGHRSIKFDEPTKKSKNFNKNSFRPQELKAQAPQRSNNAETFKKARKEKKTTANTKKATEPHKIEDHKEAPP